MLSYYFFADEARIRDGVGLGCVALCHPLRKARCVAQRALTACEHFQKHMLGRLRGTVKIALVAKSDDCGILTWNSDRKI